MQTAECRERTGAVKTVSPYPPSVTGVKNSMLCAPMSRMKIRKVLPAAGTNSAAAADQKRLLRRP